MRWSRTRRNALALGLTASLLVVLLELPALLGGGLARLDPLQPLENTALDLAVKWQGRTDPEPGKVAVVGIDLESLDRHGRWPWPRPEVARLLDAIERAGARVVAVDLLFSHRSEGEPGTCGPPVPEIEPCLLPPDDCALAHAFAGAALSNGGNVVSGYILRERRRSAEAPGLEPFNPLQLTVFNLAYQESEGRPEFPLLRTYPEVTANLTCFDVLAAGNGFANHPSHGHVVRHYQVGGEFQPDGTEEGRYVPALAVTAAARYLGAELRVERRPGDLPAFYLDSGDGETRTEPLPVDERGRLWIDHLGPSGTVPTVSAADLLEDHLAEEDRRKLDGALVFLGVTEDTAGDVRATPFDESVPGVEIHATVAYNLLTGRFLHDSAAQHMASLLVVLVVGPLVALLVSGIERYLLGSVVAIFLVALWPLAAYQAFVDRWHLLFVAPMLAGLLSLVVTLRYQIQLGSRFEGYVSPNVARAIRRDPELARRSRSDELTVLFTDIRGFSTRTEEMGSEQVVRLLNDFFTPMTRVVLDQDGTLDKYMGDALMAFFGAPVPQPDHAVRACRAALAMRRELQVIRRSREEMKDLDIGIGLNTGPMTVGDMGSEGLFDYTVIGKNVNLGQRLEAATKPEAFGVGILVAERTREMAGEGFLFRKVARLQAKGFRHPVTLYELVTERPAPGLEPPGWTQPAFVREFERAYELYYPGRDFAAAEAAFGKLVEAHPEDRPSRYYLERCRELQTNPPPPDWKGIEEQTKK